MLCELPHYNEIALIEAAKESTLLLIHKVTQVQFHQWLRELGERAVFRLSRRNNTEVGVLILQNQHLVLLLMALGPKDVSRVLLGPLSPYT
uniref:Uncharacterized protein n=1 Tax=Daphnia galeata TaxID=27404 RepID=A0A8J2RIZ1_9CRUS|nr:unnamed protein product [Daphnia galeata]